MEVPESEVAPATALDVRLHPDLHVPVPAPRIGARAFRADSGDVSHLLRQRARPPARCGARRQYFLSGWRAPVIVGASIGNGSSWDSAAVLSAVRGCFRFPQAGREALPSCFHLFWRWISCGRRAIFCCCRRSEWVWRLLRLPLCCTYLLRRERWSVWLIGLKAEISSPGEFAPRVDKAEMVYLFPPSDLMETGANLRPRRALKVA